jgi:hypothetical protein
MTTLSISKIRQLDHWLETDPDRFERYLRKHPEIADIYENLNTLSDQVRSVLNDAMSIPADFATRILDRTAERSATDESSVAMDLFGVGIATLANLFDTSPLPTGHDTNR